MTLVSTIIMLTILIAALFIIWIATLVPKKYEKWCVALVSLIGIGILIPIINLSNEASREMPQLIADEIGIDVSSVYYDKKSELWFTDDASYRAVFTEQELIKTKSGIKAHAELKSLVKTGEMVIK